MTSPLSRRQLLRSALGAGSALAAVPWLSSCAPPTEASTLHRSRTGLRVLNWPKYIDTGDTGTVARFSQATTIQAMYSEDYADNESVWAKISPPLQAGQPLEYDIIVPTFWLAARLISNGWVESLPLDLIPNHANLDPAFLRLPFDRGSLANLPWQSGITGIAYNTKLTPPVRSLKDLVSRPELKGRVGFSAELTDSIGLAMLAQGNDPSKATVRSANTALDYLRTAKESGHITKFANNDEYLAGLDSGDFAACLAFSGDIAQLRETRPEFEFAIPEEGGMRWFDTMVIPRRSPNGGAAAEWMNFVYDPDNAAKITAEVRYVSPVVGVRDALKRLGGDAAQLADNPLLFPDGATRRNLFTWNGLSTAEEETITATFRTLVES